jgi:hypothetical protein
VLSTADGRLVGPDGAEVEFRGAISCCGGGYGWPLVDEGWMDLVGAAGVRFLHVRLGPFLTGPGGESDWAETGGGYVEVDGRADLDQWNETFWSRVRDLLRAAGERGMWVEIDVADGWAVKHCRWGDVPGYSAWDAAHNVQEEDACATAGSGAIVEGSVHDLWVRKVVDETGRYGNVFYQDGNELGLVDGYAPEWTRSIQERLRAAEAAHAWPRHLLGTNSDRAETIDAVDVVELHQVEAADGDACLGKPCLVNEYNPDPPLSLSPAEILDRYCAAESFGTYFWYWRHGQSAEDMEASLAALQSGCP